MTRSKQIRRQRRHSQPLVLVVLLLVCSLGSAGHAWGNNLKIYTQEIRTLYRKGKKLVQKKKYMRAVLKFRAALALIEQSLGKLKEAKDRQAMRKRKAGFLFVIARTYQYDKQFALAYMFYQRSLAAGAAPKTAALARKRMALFRPKVLVKVVLRSTPEGADFTLTNVLRKTSTGHTPYTKMMPPGTYLFTLTRPGYKPYKRTIKIPPKRGLTLSVPLQEQLATMELRSVPPGAQVVVQGKKRYQGKTPLTLQVPPGQYALLLKLDGYLPQRATLSLKPDTRLQREFRLVAPKPKARTRVRPPVRIRPLPPLPHPKRNSARVAGFSTLIIAALAGGGGTALYFLANSAFEEYNDRAGKLENQGSAVGILEDYSRGQTMRVLAHVTVGVAAAAAITAMGMFIWNGGPQPTRKATPPSTIQPVRTLLHTP